MQSPISVVINTSNEERNIEQAIKSVNWADEIIVCDMYSEDKTVEIAREMGAKIFFHQKERFVEPARNFAVSKAANGWVLILDADERIPITLAKKLMEIVSKMPKIDYVRVPRKNLIFGHFMQAAMWWPDFNVRFFQKGKVKWMDKIHRPPRVWGRGLDLPAHEDYAIIHRNYETISQFIERMDKYTSIQAEELAKEGYQFDWKDLFEKPLGEFLSRFFASHGYKDGLHGLSLSLLQAFSFVVVYLKLWERDKFPEYAINLKALEDQKNRSAKSINYWIKQSGQSGNFFKDFLNRISG